MDYNNLGASVHIIVRHRSEDLKIKKIRAYERVAWSFPWQPIKRFYFEDILIRSRWIIIIWAPASILL